MSSLTWFWIENECDFESSLKWHELWVFGKLTDLVKPICFDWLTKLLDSVTPQFPDLKISLNKCIYQSNITKECHISQQQNL